MPTRDEPTNDEREQTDESLRLERGRSDRLLADNLALTEETADEVVRRARELADEVLAAARAKEDSPARAPARSARTAKSLEREGAIQEHALHEERAHADETLRNERADAEATLREDRTEHLKQLSFDRDETNKDLSQERARADASLATRDEFLAIVSHDLRDLLHTIILLAGRISAEALEETAAEKIQQHTQRIQHAGGRMHRLIGDLIDVASIEAGALAVTREESDAAKVVREAASLFEGRAAEQGIALTVEIASPLPTTSFDPARILQVLGNLLGNAIKFTPSDSTVRVSVECLDSDLHFAVSDTGPGIAEDRLDCVFERFVQGGRPDPRGMGLGLYISKSIVAGHDGQIWAESTLGAGSTFRFTLPISV